ncbi:Uncharacterized protein dnm_091120 [Desulfonema magnum]|uniref:Uncharacterized protein n=1 Tax=Desulfonema magnum TaxID=45655 RepID=A0A975BWW5_9BACT|nr:Uncharacterized protein dnm_091120 [Desulfonema magnum]
MYFHKKFGGHNTYLSDFNFPPGFSDDNFRFNIVSEQAYTTIISLSKK